MGQEAATVEVEDEPPLEEATDDEDDVVEEEEVVVGGVVTTEEVVGVVVFDVELEIATYPPIIIIRMMITITPIIAVLDSALFWPNFILSLVL